MDDRVELDRLSMTQANEAVLTAQGAVSVRSRRALEPLLECARTRSAAAKATDHASHCLTGDAASAHVDEQPIARVPMTLTTKSSRANGGKLEVRTRGVRRTSISSTLGDGVEFAGRPS